VSEMSKENQEITCCEYFLDWYNKQHKRNYIYEKAEAHLTELVGKLRWDFVAYERANPQEWIGIEVKELDTTRDISRWSEFWEKLCLELTQNLASKGIQGEFKLIHPPVFNLKPEERSQFRKSFAEVLIDKESILKPDFIDIGPDIACKFTKWPQEKTRGRDEYHAWGKYRPSELLINKNPDSICKVISPISPIRVRDFSEVHKKIFAEVFKPKGNGVQPNKQLELAKEKRARKTILLLACYPFIEEYLIKNQVQNLERDLISDIDCIYLVDMRNKGRVVNIYPD